MRTLSVMNTTRGYFGSSAASAITLPGEGTQRGGIGIKWQFPGEGVTLQQLDKDV